MDYNTYTAAANGRYLTRNKDSRYFSYENMKFWHSKLYYSWYEFAPKHYVNIESVRAFEQPRSYRILIITPEGKVVRWGDREFTTLKEVTKVFNALLEKSVNARRRTEATNEN